MIVKNRHRTTLDFLTPDSFHSISLATWGSNGASKEAKLTFLNLLRYFSAKIGQSSKTFKDELKSACLGQFLKVYSILAEK